MADSFSSSQILNIRLPQVTQPSKLVSFPCVPHFRMTISSSHTSLMPGKLIDDLWFPTLHVLPGLLPTLPDLYVSPAAYITFALGYVIVISNLRYPKTKSDLPHTFLPPPTPCILLYLREKQLRPSSCSGQKSHGHLFPSQFLSNPQQILLALPLKISLGLGLFPLPPLLRHHHLPELLP